MEGEQCSDVEGSTWIRLVNSTEGREVADLGSSALKGQGSGIPVSGRRGPSSMWIRQAVR